MKMAGLRRSPIFSLYGSARLIDFAGWEMPVYFSSIKQEHLAVREKAGLFDTSHMGEILVRGKDALSFAQRVFSNDLARISSGKAQYGAFLNYEAGIIDDVIAYLLEENEVFFCVNAVNTEKDYKWLVQNLAGDDAQILNLSEQYAQLALQGPVSAQVLSRLNPEPAEKLAGFEFCSCILLGEEAMVSRTGYTGEDGFEIFYPAEKAPQLWQAFLEKGADLGLIPCGLGARDTLRLEMGYPLWGRDINEDTTPLEAGLDWIVGWQKPNFIGKDFLERQKNLGVAKKRVGIMMTEPGIARTGYPIKKNSQPVGKITSGTKTPCLEQAIAMGYVAVEYSQSGTELLVEIRGKDKKARVVVMPFYQKS